jgi:hypothetical protein
LCMPEEIPQQQDPEALDLGSSHLTTC